MNSARRGAYYLFFAQSVAHASIVPMVLFASWQEYAISLAVYFFTSCLGMTMTYHRLLSHRSWNPPKVLEYLFSLFATVGLTGSAISWVAIHRKHHKYTDKPQDPHSPSHKGWFYCHFLSMFAKVEIKYVTDLIKDPFYKFQHKYYYLLNGIWAATVYGVFKEPLALVYAWLFPAMILWNAGSSIVSFSHRNQKSYNDLTLAFLVWGEGYHENHHANANLSRFGRYDFGGFLIDLFSKKEASCNEEKV